MPFLTLAVMPSSTTFLASVGEWSSPMFSDLLPFATFAIGIILGVSLISFIILAIARAFHKD